LDSIPKTEARPVTKLPAEPTPFIGRQNELTEIKPHLFESRLLTLTGPGGIGKSRLALKTAEGISAAFEDGCYFVSLAPLRSTGDITQTIAEAVGFPIATQEDPQDQLIRYLRNKELLLVMDNFEHLLDGSEIVSKILRASPDVRVLATSREKLNLQSEMVINIGGMSLPDQTGVQDTQNYDAIDLFLQSATRVRPGFSPSDKELGLIGDICQIVEGMPLAIELAAAWLHILNVEEIAEELAKGLDILATEARDAPERHRSIRTVFDHSWSLLEPIEQEIFMRLSVFRGGFTRDAAQKVAGATLQQLAGLVNKSFLSHIPDSGRLQVHELLRQYAQEKLEESLEAMTSAQEAHGAYFAGFMQQRREDLKGHRQMFALAEIEADVENVRAAWRFYLEQKNAAQLWLFIYGLWHVHWIRWWNYPAIALFAEAARALDDVEDKDILPLRALAMALQSYFMAWTGFTAEGYKLARESIEILRELDQPEALVFALDGLSINAYFIHRYKEEIEAIKEMCAIATKLDDKWLEAFTLFALSMGALVMEDFSEAKRLAEIDLKLYEEIGNVIESSTPLIVLGHAALAVGELEEARGHYLRCLKISQETGFHYAGQTATKYLAKVSISMGKTAEAQEYLNESLRITKEIGFVRDIINLCYEYARLYATQGKIDQAVELLALVIQHPTSVLYRMLEGRMRDSAKDLLAKIEGELSQEAFAEAVHRGQSLEIDAVVADLMAKKTSRMT
jgi:predicted ATPase